MAARRKCRKIHITLISASNLEKVRKWFKMRVYPVVSIAKDHETKRRAPADEHNKTNPAWKWTTTYTVGEEALDHDGVMLVIELYCERTVKPDKYIGEVHTSIKELYERVDREGGDGLTYDVQRGAVVSQGEVKLLCRFGETVIIEEEEGGENVIIKEGSLKNLVKKGAVIFLQVMGLVIPLVTGTDWE